MALPCFVTALPVLGVTRRSLPIASRAARMSSGGPQAPEGFEAPKPRVAYVRPDALPRIAGASLGLLLRAGSGATVAGYTVKIEDGKLVESSSSLPTVRPEQPLVLYAFPACPFCRKVYEALSTLDLDVLVKPCPKDGKIYRPYVVENFGKSQFPYLYDPNSGFSGYESDEIISFLYKTYGTADARVPLAQRNLGTFSAGLASLAGGRGGARRESDVVVPPKPLVVWGYEPSPFCRVVFERLSELEIPYVWKTTPRGSPSRAYLKELTGRVQVPYLQDPNTGVDMFESADIVDYLDKVYGPDARGAKAEPTPEEVTNANSFGVPASAAVVDAFVADAVSKTQSGDLNPSPPIDPKLEEYCETAPDADECRTYDT